MSKHQLTKRSVRRSLSLTAASAMVFALMPLGSATAQEATQPEPIGNADVCPPPADSNTGEAETLTDISGVHAENIRCVVNYDIAEGYPDNTYRPGVDIKRDQMATFIANYVETALGETLATGEDAFTDDDDNIHEPNINKLAGTGIIQGVGGTFYQPKREVSRAAMATFIANAIDYLDDREVNGSIPPATANDYFPDDDATTHEENINRLAEQGIVQGKTDGLYHPREAVNRGQMATFIIHAAEYADELGLWAPTAGAPPASNQTFTVTPAEAAENTVSDADAPNRGARQYSVSGLDDAVTYDVVLFPCENVTNTDGVITFADEENAGAGDNEADTNPENVAAVIEVVNGAAVAAPQDEHVEVSPVNGTISFTVDSETADCVIPVIFVDTENDNTLELDADNAPTEAFGIGGSKTFIPEEAATGALGTSDAEDETIVSVNKDSDRIVTEAFTYFYDSNDRFFVSAGETPCSDAANEVTLAQFEAELSAGDELDANTFYNSNNELQSRFCLEDVAPVTPTVTATDERDTSVAFTVTGVQPGATVVVYCGPNDDNAFNRTTDTRRGETTTDQDPNTAGFQVIATGLQPGTAYDCFITQIVDGEESAPTARQDVTTDAQPTDTTRPTIRDAQVTTDAGLQGVVTTGDVWILTFDEDMNETTATSGTFVLEDEDGDRFTVDCGEPGNTDAAGSGAIAADCTLSTNGQVLTIRIQENVGAGNDQNAAGDGVLEYPATIVSTDTDVQDEQGNVVDLANSPDRVVDNE